MSRQLVLHIDGRWLAFDDDRIAIPDARPRIVRPTVVVTDFDGSVSDVTSLEGSPSHAMALIERRLRADGLLDGDSKVLIHQSRTVGNGYQALFTAVPLDRWQSMFGWAEGQDDHTLLIPLVGLLWKRLRPGQGVVLQSGRKIVFLAALRNSVVHASALAFSDSREDLAMTVAALGDRAGTLLSADDGAIEPVSIEWIAALTPMPSAAGTARLRAPAATPARDRWPAADDTPTERTAAAVPSDEAMSFDGQDEYVHAMPSPSPTPASAIPTGADARQGARDADTAQEPLDEFLSEIFAASSGATVVLAASIELKDAEGRAYRSGAVPMLRSASPSAAVNSGASRAMDFAERVLPWASAASLVLALGLAALGGRWTLAAHGEGQRADALHADIAALEESASMLEARHDLPADFPAIAAFIGRATTLTGALDPSATLLTLREAAATDVRILRVRLDTVVPDKPTLRVDGLVNYGSGARDGDRGQQIARFVQRLRDAGYVPVAIDPQAGNAGGSAPGGLFSYQLSRATPMIGAEVTP